MKRSTDSPFKQYISKTVTFQMKVFCSYSFHRFLSNTEYKIHKSVITEVKIILSVRVMPSRNNFYLLPKLAVSKLQPAGKSSLAPIL